jgi:muramidase (phage lysozyme)
MNIRKFAKRVLPSVAISAVSFFYPNFAMGKTGAAKAAKVEQATGKANDPDRYLKLANPTARQDLTAHERAFLDMIAYSEGTLHPKGYSTLFGGEQFNLTNKHPRKVVCNKHLCSTAAGRYQILSRTDKEIKVTGFNPKAQDTKALKLIRRRNALRLVRQGKVSEAIDLCSEEWASFPGSPYGQPTHTKGTLLRFFEDRVNGYLRAEAMVRGTKFEPVHFTLPEKAETKVAKAQPKTAPTKVTAKAEPKTTTARASVKATPGKAPKGTVLMIAEARQPQGQKSQ